MECHTLANPGFAGIGVRLSIYIQAILVIVSTSIRSYVNGRGSSREEFIESTFRSSVVILFSGLAISLSALFEATTYGLSVYHALVMLNLCWVVASSALAPFFSGVEVGDEVIGKQQTLDQVGLSTENPRKGVLEGRRLILYSVHLTVASSIGLWLFIRMRDFDTSSHNCTLSTVAVIVGHGHLVSGNTYGTISLVVYAAFVLPIFNAGLLFLLALAFSLPSLSVGTFVGTLVIALVLGRPTDFMEKHFPHIPLALLIATGLVIISTEQTIWANSDIHEEERWSISQALALMVAFIPAIDFGAWTWEKVLETNRDSEDVPNHPTLGDDLSNCDLLKNGNVEIEDRESTPGKDY